MFPTLQRLIDHLNHKIRLITGSIHKLYTLSGERITTIDALEHQHGYVVVAKDDPFIRAQYNLNAIVPLEHPERSVAGSAAVKKIRRRKGEEGSAGGSRVGSEKGERKVKRRKKKVKAKEGHIEEEEHQHEPVHEEGHAKSPQQHREEDHPPAERKIVYTKPTIKPAVAAAPVVPAPAHAGTTFLTEPAHPPQPQYSTRDLPIVAPPPAPQHELKPTAEHRDIKEHAHHADTDGDGDEPPPQGFFRHLGQKVDQMLDGDDSPSPVHGEKKAQNPQDRKHRKKRPDTDQEYDSGDEPPSSDHAEKTKTTTKSTQKLNTTLAKSRDEIRADATESVRKSRAALRSGGSGGDHESSTTTHTTTAKLATTRKPTKTESKRHHRASSVPSSDGEDNRDSRKDEVETDPEPDDANEVYGDSQLRELKSTTGGKTVRRVRRVRRKGGDDEGEEEEEEGEEVEVGQSEGGGKTGKVTTTRKIRDGRRRTTRKQGGGGASDDDDNDEEDASDTDPRTHAKYTTTTTTRTETSTPNSKLPGAAKGKNGFRLFGGKKNNNEGSGVESGDEGRSVGGSEYDGEEGRGSEVKEKTAAAGLPGLPRKKNVL
ncbi:uncharacterized protein EV422DRAFT_162813 [Fimicolochytrium jonesii]|uniref:uncharacterized protein n=1 Tax=Fimicolochytrium jonesii TaxID=1396493 RepID=UPI0022FE009B|nr:uncharacterized protein EV422DRAFT_162813 [Fimicolochytrium jonesii]KAI8818720.1 hypothetical protein EV422DRAFT_162813 [Fimicolochytrium jonesii]